MFKEIFFNNNIILLFYNKSSNSSAFSNIVSETLLKKPGGVFWILPIVDNIKQRDWKLTLLYSSFLGPSPHLNDAFDI